MFAGAEPKTKESLTNKRDQKGALRGASGRIPTRSLVPDRKDPNEEKVRAMTMDKSARAAKLLEDHGDVTQPLGRCPKTGHREVVLSTGDYSGTELQKAQPEGGPADIYIHIRIFRCVYIARTYIYLYIYVCVWSKFKECIGYYIYKRFVL